VADSIRGIVDRKTGTIEGPLAERWANTAVVPVEAD
jgi:hypothetical protein